MENAHDIAWKHVKKHLFGTVCEVTRTKPWGFIEDKPNIINKTVEEFLSENERYDTVILHILSGEGEPRKNILKVIKKAYKNAVKIIVLEHNPNSTDFDNLRKIDFIDVPMYEYENWGRNMLYVYTTLFPLYLDLNDNYNDRIFVEQGDHGTCQNNLIYTHTSETPIDFELPDGETWWVIGGGIPYESMRDGDILIDSSLRQCLYAGLKWTDKWKIDRIYKFKPIKENEENLPHWRKVKDNGNKPKLILHKSLNELNIKNKNIYVSTVNRIYWEHLTADNTILEAWTERDKIKLL